ncbi:hypothetical protein BDN72DRAFT_675624 [Pluteus cervinus]|uniref:Uncharacterized protein n=1 Tax=Pluteus cervinus TaxID=181527 RepID=A0ACD3ASR5_9AGAR|nr:hypothetical protein BDN72DRAFT_675624 [Pluteus cervinus]
MPIHPLPRPPAFFICLGLYLPALLSLPGHRLRPSPGHSILPVLGIVSSAPPLFISLFLSPACLLLGFYSLFLVPCLPQSARLDLAFFFDWVDVSVGHCPLPLRVPAPTPSLSRPKPRYQQPACSRCALTQPPTFCIVVSTTGRYL